MILQCQVMRTEVYILRQVSSHIVAGPLKLRIRASLIFCGIMKLGDPQKIRWIGLGIIHLEDESWFARERKNVYR